MILYKKDIITLKQVEEALMSYTTRKKDKFENIDGETLAVLRMNQQ